MNFLRENAIVGLAVGFVAGSQAQALVKTLISSFLDLAFKLLFGKELSKRTFTLHLFNNWADFGWGAFVYALLNVLFVLAAIYAIIKLFKLDRLNKPKDPVPTEIQNSKAKTSRGSKAAKDQAQK